MRLLRIAVFGVGAALSLTGCGGGSDPAPKSLDEFDANKAACAFSANDGEGAFAPSSSDILTSHFGKRIDINQLKAVLTSSGEETASFVKSLDVDLFSGPEKEPNCHFFSFLEAAQGDYLRLWNQANSGNRTLGLYLAKGLSELTAQKPVIIVRKDSSRWTLIHELGHHLFNLNAVYPDDLSEREFRIEYRQRLKALLGDVDSDGNVIKKSAEERYDQTPSQENLDDWQEALIEFYPYMDVILKEGALEEVAIERTLSDFYTQDQLQYVAEVMLDNSVAYACVNAYGFEIDGERSVGAKDYFEMILDQIAKIRKARGSDPDLDSIEVASQERLAEIDRVIASFPRSCPSFTRKSMSGVEHPALQQTRTFLGSEYLGQTHFCSRGHEHLHGLH